MQFFTLFLFSSVSPLLTVFRFLTRRTRAVRASNIFLLLRLGLYLVVLVAAVAATSLENQSAALNNVINICHVENFSANIVIFPESAKKIATSDNQRCKN